MLAVLVTLRPMIGGFMWMLTSDTAPSSTIFNSPCYVIPVLRITSGAALSGTSNTSHISAFFILGLYFFDQFDNLFESVRDPV